MDAQPIEIDKGREDLDQFPSEIMNNSLIPPTGGKLSYENHENACKDRISIRANQMTDLDSLLVFTKAVSKPTWKETIIDQRFLQRFLQLLTSLGAFISLGYTVFRTNYTTLILENSGISFFVFFVSLSNLFLYSFPGFLGIPPHRHTRVSRVESSFDIILSICWIVATAQLNSVAQCPYLEKPTKISQLFVYVDFSTKFCPTLVSTLILGYITTLLYIVKFLTDLKSNFQDNDVKMVGKHIMFARGNWKQQGS